MAADGSAPGRDSSPSTGIVVRMNTPSNAEQFVTRFADFWRHPSPQRLPELLHPDVVLVQPLAPRTVGLEAAQAQFHRFFYSIPGLTADVDHWSGDNDIVFIEFRLRASLGRDVLDWPNVNRLRLRDGKGIERITYFDPLAVLPTLLRHPSVARRWHRSKVWASAGSTG
ncbi:nuclear transport factor 2 family protein [Mycobacterium mantenii]|nr:nuclear transport factor 2 family protein [Mycobacterium mantenii]